MSTLLKCAMNTSDPRESRKMLPAILILLTVTAQVVSEEEDYSVFGPPPLVDGSFRIAYTEESKPNTDCLNTPSKRNGNCISIFKCDQLSEIYKKRSVTKSEKRQILFSFCGWYNGAPYVCCEKETSIGRPLPKPQTPNYSCGGSIVKFWYRIVGGRPADIGAYPWMAALYYNHSKSGLSKQECGGSLIADQWVLTAAHCVQNPKLGILDHVRLGDHDLNDSSEDVATPINVNVEKIIKHPNYSRETFHNDIALLRLSKPVNYNDFIRPICLHNGVKYLNKTYYDDKSAQVAGWGYSSSGGVRSSVLMEANLDIVRSEDCNKSYKKYIRMSHIKIDHNVLCAKKLGRDTCQGDSGGPLMFRENKKWYLGGIVSYGIQCAHPSYPGVYTKVASFIDFIRGATKLEF